MYSIFLVILKKYDTTVTAKNMKQLLQKKIGIWGYGVVGKSAVHYLKPLAQQISVFDQKTIPIEQAAQLQRNTISLYQPTELMQFLEVHDYIIPSPGIDLMPYQKYAHKFVAEFDMFCDAWQKPIIAITGTVGKTSITHILSQLLSVKKTVATGGNIGTGMLDLLLQQEAANCALLELSSFQLELCATAAPDLAIITNIYPNHIDRHGSFENYCAAKYKLCAQQRSGQQALVPLELLASVRAHFPHKAFHFFSATPPTQEQRAQLSAQQTLYYLEQQTICRYRDGQQHIIAQLTEQHISYPQNWLIIYAVLDLLAIPAPTVATALPTLNIPDHRLACIAQHQDISFYNDSKATVPEAMLAAVKKLDGAPIILFLGGVSKGVDRRAALAHLRTMSVKHVICFGKEAEQLQAACAENMISASAHENLATAFAHCMQKIAQSDDQVLFSPAGASFDLFSHYQARGDAFKNLVQTYCEENV